MARRVYAGPQPTVFMTGGVGRVRPGDGFEVPDGLEAAFDGRRDVAVPADGGGARTARRGRRAGQDGGEGEPATPDSSGEQEA